MTIAFSTWFLASEAHRLLMAGDRTRAELAAALHLAPDGICVHLRLWMELGWVERYMVGRSQRIHCYRLTDYGRSLQLVYCGTRGTQARGIKIAQLLDQYEGKTITQIARTIGVRWGTTERAIAVLIEAGIAESYKAS